MVERGEFEVSRWAAFTARNRHDQRSDRARAVDAERRAPVTTDVDRWADRPDEIDFPGVDTPRTAPRVLPADLKQGERPSVALDRPQDPLSRFEREEAAFEARMADVDVSLAPEEDIEGVATGSHRTRHGQRMERSGILAAGEEATDAFERAERELLER